MLNVKRDATGVQSYDVAVRILDGAGPHTRGVEIAEPATMALGTDVSSCTWTVKNTGATAPVTRAGRRRWTTRTRTWARTSTA